MVTIGVLWRKQADLALLSVSTAIVAGAFERYGLTSNYWQLSTSNPISIISLSTPSVMMRCWINPNFLRSDRPPLTPVNQSNSRHGPTDGVPATGAGDGELRPILGDQPPPASTDQSLRRPAGMTRQRRVIVQPFHLIFASKY